MAVDHVVSRAAFGVGDGSHLTRSAPPKVGPTTLVPRRMAATASVIAHTRGVGGSLAERHGATLEVACSDRMRHRGTAWLEW
jgi:hypothetical protein